ncbi:AI-2E family transporter [Mucilaginibacter ginkgonis]|uniref:AI-2E family transporter n=1 Tax=Mucilaginibacter ginkgonis TaxID=2682091 RepID=A0A6I4HYC9_9SPHI|nr:AI-2E family transporter [Mucilaginibacter ginkgonis]QQL49474.1 AI-2E family transporter [Mucilaginibacter ginkgonis]
MSKTRTPGELHEPTTKKELTYIQKVWQTVAIIALLVIVILIARVAFNVLLMVLAGSLISIYFNGLSGIIQRRLRLKPGISLVISIVGSFAILGVLLWFMGTTIEQQIAQLIRSLPGTINNVKQKLSESPAGQQVLEALSSTNSQKMMGTVQSFFSTSFGVLGNLYIILLLSIFFTVSPALYTDGIILLFPPERKPVARHIISRISASLKGWVKSTILTMVVLATMISIGLTIMGIPAALVLGLFTGMLRLVPNFGAIIAMVPGTLLGLTEGTGTGIIVALIYIVSQTIVNNIVAPLVQKRMINMPPALTIISQVIMGTLSGGLGIILAVPLLAIVFILVEELYINKMEDGNVDDRPVVGEAPLLKHQ